MGAKNFSRQRAGSDDQKRILDRCIPEPMSGCWLWEGAVWIVNGYWPIPNVGKGSGRPSACRLSYQTFVGPIPDGHFVCHRCDNPWCVNPDHLFTGTATDNARDMVAKGRSRHVKGWRHVTPEIRQIFQRAKIGEQSALAREYGVSEQTVSYHRKKALAKIVEIAA